MEDLKDARARLANTQDETAKLKLEYVNQIDKLAYEIEEGARLDRFIDKIQNEKANLSEEKS